MLSGIIIVAACIGQLQVKQIVTAHAGEVAVAPGANVTAIIHVQVKEGYHIQANRVSDESLVPVTLTIMDSSVFHIGQAVFPRYKLFRLEGTTNYLNVFDSTFSIQVPITIPAAIKPGRYLVKARLHYQACDTRTCLFPRTLEVELVVVVGSR